MHPTFTTPILRTPPFRTLKMAATTPATSSSPNADLWKRLTAIPTLQSGRMHGLSIIATFVQRDLITSTKRTFTTTYTRTQGTYINSPPTEAPPTYLMNAPFRYLRFPSGEKETFLEVYESHALASCHKLPHGKLYTDDWFAGVAVSADDQFVAYIAEASHESDGEDWHTKLVEKYDIRASDPLGESYTEKRGPHLFIHHLPSGTTKQVLQDMEIIPGQPVWHGRDLVFTLRSATPNDMLERFGETVHDLGVRFCYNRYSQIGCISLDGDEVDAMERLPSEVRVLSEGELCCFLPTVYNHRLVYFATLPAKDGMVQTHNPTKVLRHVDLSQFSKPTTLISIPEDPQVGEFPGLYVHDLPVEPWVDDHTFVFTSVWGSINRLLAARVFFDDDEKPVIVDLIQQARSQFRDAGLEWVTKASIRLLDVHSGMLLIGASDPATPTQLLLLHVTDGSVTKVFSVTKKLESMQSLSSDLQHARTVDLVALHPGSRTSFSETAREFAKDSDEPSERFQVTVLQPGKENKRYLVVYPHGGPHTSTVNAYSPSAMALLQKGYTVLYINYRGSLGLGERSLSSLPGNVGTQDVNEVVQATRWALKTYDLSGASFVGGSHSGFLGAHTSLIPGLFHGTVLRNPVVDIASMQGGTDIPDWSFCEAGVPATPGFIANAEALKQMFQVSPVAFVNECDQIGKTLLQLGKGDRRVPVGQGLLWRRVLNGRFGDVCDTRFYPACGHAVDEVPEGDDAWVAALDFLDATVMSPPTECLHISHRKS